MNTRTTIAQLYELFLKYPSIQTDTRKLKKGDLFFALKGPNFNGNKFAAQALDKGAAYAVIDEAPTAAGHYSATGSSATTGPSAVTKSPSAAAPSDRMILVPDVLTALQALSLHHREQFDIPFIAITGSNGKTTTKELVYTVLASQYKVYTTQGNLNNHIGVPLTLLSVKKDAQFAVIEMGANHQGEIRGYCEYARPTHGIITNAGLAHLEGFGGPEGVKKGKGELYDFLRQTGGSAFVMWDYDYLRAMSKGIPEIISYGTRDAGIDGSSGVIGIAEKSEPFLSVNIKQGATTGLIHTQLVGDYNLPNVLVAVSVGKHFGVTDDNIRSAIENYAPSNSRSQLIEKESNHIILDAYNANPSSMQAAIENFAGMKGEEKVLLLGGMAELGPGSVEEHRRIVDLIGRYPWQHVALVGGDFLKTDHPWKSFGNAKEAGQWLRGLGLRNAYILIKGSRSMRMEEALS